MTDPYVPNTPRDGQQWGQWQPSAQQDPQQPRWSEPTRNEPVWEQQQPQPQQGWGEPQQGGWQQPQQPQYGQPWQQGGEQGQWQPQAQATQYGQPWQQGGGVPLMPPPKKSGGRTKIIASAAAVIVIGGGVATYVAVSSSSGSGGASSPQAAVQSMVGDLDNSDLLGLLNDLAPGERDAISKPFTESVNNLKKSDVVSPKANLSKVDAVKVKTSGLKYAPGTIKINNHVQIVQLTAGTVAVNADALKLPFTSDVLNKIKSSNGPTSQTETINIADAVRKQGHPVRIATQKVGGTWYPSLLYTIADNVATSQHLQAPAAADSIPAVGASSADDAVRSMIEALISGNYEKAIELTSPDELQVLHDYGPLIVARAPRAGSNSTQVSDIQFTDTSIDGGTRVSLKSLTISSDGSDVTVTVNGSCYTASAQGQTKKFCASDLLNGSSDSLLGGNTLTTRQRTALNDLFSKVGSLGIDTSTSGGSWYVNPIRSYFDLSNVLLSGLKGSDGKVLIDLLASS